MIDLITKQRITVEGEPLTGAHIIVPIEQLPAVREGLERGGVTFWVADAPILIDDDPPVMWVSLSRSSDAAQVQRILDTI